MAMISGPRNARQTVTTTRSAAFRQEITTKLLGKTHEALNDTEWPKLANHYIEYLQGRRLKLDGDVTGAANAIVFLRVRKLSSAH